MGIYITPSYIKPHTKIATWIIPMCYLEEDNNEYINDNGIVKTVIKDYIDYYSRGTKMTMKTDTFGEPIQYKVHADTSTMNQRPLVLFIEQAIGNRQLMTLEGKFNLLTSSGVKLIQEVFNNLSEDMRSTIAVPLQWLVYIPSENVLTRLCWINEIEGKIIVRPYTQRSLLLEVHGKVQFDKVNTADLKVIKKNILVKNTLNEEWRQMVMEVSMEEAVERITGITEMITTKSKEEKEGESESEGRSGIGTVE